MAKSSYDVHEEDDDDFAVDEDDHVEDDAVDAMDDTTMMAIMIKTKVLYNAGYGNHLEDDADNEDCDGCDVDRE
jgi:hypothetical protein